MKSTLENAAFANPGLNITIHPDNIRAVFNDPPDVVMTEVLNRWVQTISSVVGAKEWQECGDETIDLDDDKLTWMAIDISPDRKHAALMAAQKLGSESFVVKLLHTWENSIQLDDRAIANDAAAYCRKYPIEYLLYSRRTSGAVAARMQPAGIPSMTWIATIHKAVTSFWAQLTAEAQTPKSSLTYRTNAFSCAIASRRWRLGYRKACEPIGRLRRRSISIGYTLRDTPGNGN
jgi:hypothetical protein